MTIDPHGVRVSVGIAAIAILATIARAEKPARAEGVAEAEPKQTVPSAIAVSQCRAPVNFVEAVGLAETLSGAGPLTVFAPSEGARAKLMAGALEGLLENPETRKCRRPYHVATSKAMAADGVKQGAAGTASGQSVRIDAGKGVHLYNANEVIINIAASNGRIRLNGTEMTPEHGIIQAGRVAGPSKTPPTAIEAQSRADTLLGEGRFIVFALTDEAFAKLPGELLDVLFKNKARLTSIRTCHVVMRKAMAADVLKPTEAKAVQGQSVKVAAAGGVTVENAKVVKTEVPATNGVIHVVDKGNMPRRAQTPET